MPETITENLLVDDVILGLGLSTQRVTFHRSRLILAEILEGEPVHEQTKIAGGNTARDSNLT